MNDLSDPQKPDSGNFEKKENAASTPPQQKTNFAEVLIKEAYELIGKNEFKAALGIFDDIDRRFGVSLDDNEKSVVCSEKALLYYYLGDYHAAHIDAEKALAYGDRNDQAYNVLGKVAVAEFKFSLARGYFSKIESENAAKPLGFCLVSLKLRERASAERYLNEASAFVPSSNPEFGVYRAYLEFLRGNTEEGLHEVRALKPKCQKNPALMLLIGEIFMSVGNCGEAVAVAKQVQTSCPENDQVYAIFAHAAIVEEDFERGRSNAERAVQLNPRNAYAKTVLMKVATRSGSYDIAERIGRQVIADSPENCLGHANLGDVYFNQGHYELSQLEYEQAQEVMDSQTKGTRLRQARMKFMNEDYKAAADILEQLVTGYHTYYDDAMCDLALCYDEMGDEAKKEEIIEKMQMRRSFYLRTERILQELE